MRATIIHLPDEIQAELERVATATGQSVDELIWEGIKLALAQHTPPAPRSGIFATDDPDLAERTDALLEDFGRR